MRLAKIGLTTLLLTLPLSAQAQSLIEARAFVAGLYAAYSKGSASDNPDYLGRKAGTVFAPRLLRLIRLDAASTPKGMVGALDGDPICDCQDPDGLRLIDVKVASSGSHRALAIAHIGFPSETRTLRLELLSIRGAWRIDDIRSQDIPSLARFLQAHAGGR